MDKDAFRKEIVVAINGYVIDVTISTHLAKFAITSSLENLNTRHPRDSRNRDFFKSISATMRLRCDLPSTSIAILASSFAMSTL